MHRRPQAWYLMPCGHSFEILNFASEFGFISEVWWTMEHSKGVEASSWSCLRQVLHHLCPPSGAPDSFPSVPHPHDHLHLWPQWGPGHGHGKGNMPLLHALWHLRAGQWPSHSRFAAPWSLGGWFSGVSLLSTPDSRALWVMVLSSLAARLFLLPLSPRLMCCAQGRAGKLSQTSSPSTKAHQQHTLDRKTQGFLKVCC